MKDIEIKGVSATEILDSRGNPTVRAEVTLASGAVGAASVPSGASTGQHEAFEKRDGGKRYRGRGVLGATEAVNGIIAPALVGVSAAEQERIDGIMITLDGTADKSKLGANAILAVSLATARAAAADFGMPLYRYLGGCSANLLPLPMMNILNGGAHADNNVDIQEFMIVPRGMESFSAALRAGAEIYASLRGILSSRGLSVGVGDEGGFAPSLKSEREAIDLIIEAISAAGYRAGEDVSLALDIASSEWYDRERGIYKLRKSGEELDSQHLCKKICSLVDDYPIISVEDGMAEDDFEGWAMLTDRLRGKNVMLVGDDLFVTNRERLIVGCERGIANAILMKPNQIGTLSEACDTAAAAGYRGYTTVMSHRSGDTADSFIADLAVALGSPFIKSGAPARGERVAKYNRLLLIENEMFSPSLAGEFLK